MSLQRELPVVMSWTNVTTKFFRFFLETFAAEVAQVVIVAVQQHLAFARLLGFGRDRS